MRYPKVFLIGAYVAALIPFGAKGANTDFDAQFGVNGVVRPITFPGSTEDGRSAAINVDGEIFLSGGCTIEPGKSSICVRKFASNGADIVGFGVGGRAVATLPAGDVLLSTRGTITFDGSGKIVVAKPCINPTLTDITACVARFHVDGSLDSSFNSQGVVPGLLKVSDRISFSTTPASLSYRVAAVVDRSGRLLVAGNCDGSICLTRLLQDGAVDTSFQDASIAHARALNFGGSTSGFSKLLLDASDRLVIAGTCNSGAAQRACVGRLLSNGETDPVFSNPEGFGSWFRLSPESNSDRVTDATLDSNGKILLNGPCGGSTAFDTCVRRLNMDGTIDATFSNGMAASAGTSKLGFMFANWIESTPDGRVIVAGTTSGLGPSAVAVARLDNSGSFDLTWARLEMNQFGKVSFLVPASGNLQPATAVVDNLKVDDHGRVVISATCQTSTNVSACMVRLNGDRAAACALNADANNQVASNDAMLAVRYLLGYTGNALTDGALGANPGRTTQQIESHLAQLKTEAKLDADGDGEVNAMTDGLLILRAMLGLSGDALIAGARNVSHPNVRSAQQILTWVEATHGVACLP